MPASFAHPADPHYQLHLDIARQCLVGAFHEARAPLVTTKFGPDSSVLLHLVTQLQSDVQVLWIDTGYNRRDTLNFAAELTERLALNLTVYRPLDASIVIPPALNTPEHTTFTENTKLEPFERAMCELDPDVWISSIRRYQTEHRAKQPMIDTSEPGRLKVSPLIDWSADTVERYQQAHDLPIGPDVYDPTKGESVRECGLHLTNTSGHGGQHAA